MEERLKQLRKALKLTQGTMGDKLRFSANYIYLLESAKAPITDKVISLICDTYNVNEEWFREGTGEMFKPMDRAQEVALITQKLLQSEENDFVYRLINVLANLNDDQVKVLKGIADQLLIDQNNDK